MKTSVRSFRAVLSASVALLVLAATQAQELYVRVVDVGAGECVVIKAPGSDGDHYAILDAGNYEDEGRSAMEAIREIIEPDSAIDLLVLSHSDSDHVAAVPAIIKEYDVRQAIHPGISRATEFWKAAVAAIRKEAREENCENWSLATKKIKPGTEFEIGDAKATVVIGYSKPPTSWGLTEQSEIMNAGSIVVRLTYGGKSVLFCGDSVGRHIDDPENTCIAAEKDMCDNANHVTIDSDVIIAPHHGADNGSSKRFIEAVSPEYVIFSAGHKFDHPRAAAAKRYVSAGVPISKIFRTDRGDDESAKGDKEWDNERKAKNTDRKGDDDVEVRISADGHISVQYMNP